MAFQQPLVPVLPVARELIAKTKWVHMKGHHTDGPKRVMTPKQGGPAREGSLIPKRFRTLSTMSPKTNSPTPAATPPVGEDDLSALGLVAEPSNMAEDEIEDERKPARRKLLKVFGKRRRSNSRARGSFESGSSASVGVSLGI
jgi:hypothetical protein